jgi:hypothetical protein
VRQANAAALVGDAPSSNVAVEMADSEHPFVGIVQSHKKCGRGIFANYLVDKRTLATRQQRLN